LEQANIGAPPLTAMIRIPVNKLSVNLTSQLVYYRHLKVLIVAETLIAEMPDIFLQCATASAFVSNSTPTLSLSGTPSFMSKKNFCIDITS